MHIERLFTAGSLQPQDMMRMAMRDGVTVPEAWSHEAAEAFSASLFANAPAKRRVVEENTMPSWLWQRKADGEAKAAEASVLDVFDRLAGAAAYQGWKNGLLQNEVEASTFYDEARALLLTRRLVFAPKDMARMGLDWAYGLDAQKANERTQTTAPCTTLILQNETVDSILARREPTAHGKWHKFLEGSQNRETVCVAFADTIAEWSALPAASSAPRASLNLMAFRHEDGSLDLKGLQQAAKLGVLLLELHTDQLTDSQDRARPLALGFANLSALLMSLGLAYDSKTGRGVAASLSALITAATTEASARIAAKIGPCAAFSMNRENAVRNLENQLRAAFGEKNDYDRLSVLPQTLNIENGIDLVLLSTVRYALEESVRLVRKYGLRHMQLTSLFHDPALAPLMDCFSQGAEAEPVLFCDYALGEDDFERRVHPSLPLALAKMGYDRADITAVIDHVVGYHTLVGAPVINHASLREKGFDDATLAKLEAYLPRVNHIQLAFTPWVLGIDFCRETLKVSPSNLKKAGFNLLGHLGFAAKEIKIANAFCCGHKKVQGVLELDESVWPVFATREDLTPEALIQMAASVQSFVMGDVELSLFVPASLDAPARGRLLLLAWEQGLRSLSLRLDGPALQAKTSAKIMKRQTAGAAAQHAAASGRKKTLPVTTPSPRTGKAKAPSRSVALKSSASKHGMKEKRG